MLVIQLHSMEKCLSYNFILRKKKLFMLFSYNFGDKKTDEKAQIGKNVCY